MEIQSEVQPLLAPTPTYNNNVPQETHKALIGWANDQWSARVRSSLITETPENHAQAIAACKAQVASRPVFSPTNPITEVEEDELVRAIKARPEYSLIDAEVANAGGSCRIVKVNLNDVLAFQPTVRVDNLATRLIQDTLSDEQLYELSFPSSQPISPDDVTVEINDRGYTVTTLDPNIRMVHWHAIPETIPLGFGISYPLASSPLQLQLYPFALMRTPNYLQVVHYRDRYILREGYNRSASLLYQNIQNVPCVLIEAQNSSLIGIRPDMLNLEIVLGDRPPRLGDFWQDAVTCSWQRPAMRKVYRISMEEMNVWR